MSVFWLNVAISVDNLSGPRKLVFDTLPGGLTLGPQLEILDAVVQSIAILVVNVFVRQERPTDVFGHHQPVLEIVATCTRGANCQHAVAPGVDVSHTQIPCSLELEWPKGFISRRLTAVSMAKTVCVNASPTSVESTYASLRRSRLKRLR